MEWMLWTVLSLVAVLFLDATVGRQLLRLTTTFRYTPQKGSSPRSRRLLVYLPGILFDGDASVATIKDAMLASVSDGMFVSYGFWRFIPKKVLKSTAMAIGRPNERDYTSIVLVGASFGGRIAADLATELYTHYGWETSAIKVVMVDTPCENNSFQEPGRTVSLVMKWLYFGPLVSALVAPIIKKTLVPPYDVDIEDGLDREQVKRTAVQQMARFMLSNVADQQRYLADNSIQWTMGLTDIEVAYLVCVRNNITVVQPAAWRKVELYTRHQVNHFSVLEVESPHCGFGQLPSLWSEAFRKALAVTPSRIGYVD